MGWMESHVCRFPHFRTYFNWRSSKNVQSYHHFKKSFQNVLKDFFLKFFDISNFKLKNLSIFFTVLKITQYSPVTPGH